ncbi:hypothetical protein [Streptomyces tagetis]|uniref:Integral membrane protein n=1 Tax=Streptomyces tagetis TaxID=2820809 RepID=A0A941B2U7_9ACTN|nr:hypothetical protein [Streptomyces sp. RG38]MBQ0827562.1 hypothetical protein [Streptomyces sp. RG38]
MSPRLRSRLSAVLIVLACLLAPCGALAAWAAYGLGDTGRYVAAMAPLATDPHVREAVADAVGEGVLEEVETAAARDGGVPGAGEAVPASDSVRLFVRDAARSFTRTAAFRAGWETANRTVHGAVLHALRDDRTAGRAVTVDLAPVTARVRSRLAEDHVPMADRIPVRPTPVTVLPAHDVDRLRKGYHVVDVAAFWLPLAAVVFAVAGIAVAACRRRAVTATALGTALGGGLLALAVVVGRRLTVAGLPGPVDGPAAGAVYDALTTTLRTAAWVLVGLGLAVAVLSWLAGRLHTRRQGPTGPAVGPAPSRARL